MSTKRRLTRTSAELDVNLKQMMGRSVPASPDFKAFASQLVLDTITSRTRDGKDKNGRRFARYSKEYVDSLEFGVFGKSSGNVNLTLSGDMLGFMDALDTSGDIFTFGWDETLQNEKAANHIQGVTVPKRDFFDLNKREQREIGNALRDFADQIDPEPQTDTLGDLLQVIGTITGEVIDG